MQRKHQMIPNTEVEIIQKDWRTAEMISQNMTKYNLTVCFGIFFWANSTLTQLKSTLMIQLHCSKTACQNP
jgi:hypothetical protein